MEQIDHLATGAAARTARKKAGKTLDAIAKRLRISESHLCNLEQGKRTWTLALLKRFERALLIIIFLAISACSGTRDDGQPKDEIKTIVIDHCEYLWIDNGAKLSAAYAFSFTHKGNCRNPIHEQ